MSKAAELASLASASETALSNRNMIINGAMQISQRSTSVTGIGASSGYFTLDRWLISTGASAGRLTMTQTSDGPSGFANCLKLDCTTADTSIHADEFLFLRHKLEGQNVQQLKKGTSDAEQITVSFYVKGNASATYVCELKDNDNNRNNTQAFSVTTSWNRVSLTFAADTTGVLDDDNAASFEMNIWIHGGSGYTGGTFASNTWASITNANRYAGSRTSFYDSTSRTLSITGVQMEVGPVATPFEHRSYGQELQLCKRYFQKIGNIPAICNSSTTLTAIGPYPVELRTTPTVGQTGVFNAQNSSDINNTQSGTGLGSNFGTNKSMFQASIPNFSGLTAPEPILVAVPANNGNRFTLDAEL